MKIKLYQITELMSKPIVALSCDVDDDDRIRLRQEYFEVVAAAGGIPVVMPPFVEQSRIGEWLDAVGAEAVLLTGGCDPDPQIYREYPREGLGRVSLRRDVYELGLLDCAMERNLAVLGICRGLQLVNVAFGGTLYQDMASQMGDEFAVHDAGGEALHQVAFVPGSEVGRLFGGDYADTNSHHHQCVRIVGDGLTVSGTTVDGVVEALECPAKRIVAVQFHPERMADDWPQMARFFVNWLNSVNS